MCTRKSHGGECDAPYQPAEALEDAVIQRLRELSKDESARERIIKDAMIHADEESSRIHDELAIIGNQSSRVKSDISKLIDVLKELGTDGLGSEKHELEALEAEKRMLAEKADRLTEQLAKLSGISDAGRHFIEEWRNVAELLDVATPEEQARLIQHLVEVIEIHQPEGEEKKGRYRLKLWSDEPDEDQPIPTETTNPPDRDAGADTSTSLTRNGVVLQVGEKAPPTGLEPVLKSPDNFAHSNTVGALLGAAHGDMKKLADELRKRLTTEQCKELSSMLVE